MGAFLDGVAAYEKKANQRLDAIFRGSIQDLAELVQTPVNEGGFMRVLTGFLRGSLQGSTTAMPRIDPSARPPESAAPGSFPDNMGQINLAIASANIDETFYLGFTASYARPREARDGFVRLPAQRWDDIVYGNVLKAYHAFP